MQTGLATDHQACAVCEPRTEVRDQALISLQAAACKWALESARSGMKPYVTSRKLVRRWRENTDKNEEERYPKPPLSSE